MRRWIAGLVCVVASAGPGAGQDVWFELHGDDESEAYGWAIAGNGPDLDGDGVPEQLATAYGEGRGGDWRGSVRLLSGADGSVFRDDAGPSSSAFGWSADWLGDVDGDGVSDYGASNRYGLVRIHSGATGAVGPPVQRRPRLR